MSEDDGGRPLPDGLQIDAQPDGTSGVLSSYKAQYTVEGLTYGGSEYQIDLKPARSRWQVAVLRGGVPLGLGVVNLADGQARKSFLRTLSEVDDDGREYLARVLVALAIRVQADWRERQKRLTSAATERAFEAALEDDSKRATELAERIGELALVATPMLRDPALLFNVGEAIAAQGVVGERENSILVYLAITSQHGEEPISLIVKGDSSGGKSHLVHTTTKLFPEASHLDFTSMSERALIYDPRSYSHKTLVIFEVHGQGNEFLNYIIRTLMSEGQIRHLTVEKTDEGLKGREIVKQGPTNFITTTTSPEGHAENETRVWSILVNDSEATTTGVLRLEAERVAGRFVSPPTERWQTLQEWLQCAGAHHVVVPFAAVLAEKLPARPLRLRRDFARLLLLVQTCAMLHQEQRERDELGRVIASPSDYLMVRELVAHTFRRAVQGLTEKTLELVTALAGVLESKVADGADEQASYSDLVKATGRPKYSISRWLRPAIEIGLVDNTQTAKGMPAALKLGKYEIAAGDVLPTPEWLAEALGEAISWVSPVTGVTHTAGVAAGASEAGDRGTDCCSVAGQPAGEASQTGPDCPAEDRCTEAAKEEEIVFYNVHPGSGTHIEGPQGAAFVPGADQGTPWEDEV